MNLGRSIIYPPFRFRLKNRMELQPIAQSCLEGTTEQQIMGIVYWLRRFQPQHIDFLLDLDKHWLTIDPARLVNIMAVFQDNFHTTHSITDVRALLSYFNHPRTIAMQHHLNLSSLTHSGIPLVTISPFSLICPMCSSKLTDRHSSMRKILVYSLSGAVTAGKLNGDNSSSGKSD